MAAGHNLAVHTADESWTNEHPHCSQAHEAALVGFLHGILRGLDFPACLDVAWRLSRYTVEHPDEPVPEDLR